MAVLEWDKDKGVIESVPPKENFIVNWRTEANHVIIIFTDERPQSYMFPKVTQDMLIQSVSGTPNLKIYPFSTPWYKENGGIVKGWEPLATATGGTWYELTSDMITMYNSLMEIIDENACK